MDAGAAPQYALANAASGLSSRLPMSAHPPASAALISTVLAMLSLAARPRPTVLATAASGCDVMLHASRHHAAALALSSGVVRLLASSRRAAGSACTSAWVGVSTAGLFCEAEPLEDDSVSVHGGAAHAGRRVVGADVHGSNLCADGQWLAADALARAGIASNAASRRCLHRNAVAS